MSESDRQADATRIYESVREYCETYNIPLENLLDILEDQKVLPMIRGKATEYIGAAILRQALDPRDWDVQKLNLNPQRGGTFDEDVSITHRMTGKRLKAETKSAVRGSFSLGAVKETAPYFRVKCHKSRSHLTRAHNDRYEAEAFDVLLCNVSNAIFRRRTLARGLELIDKPATIAWLKEHYGAADDKALVRSAYDDWRICLPSVIAQPDGTIPRTPVVRLANDPHWFPPDQLAPHLRTLINGR